MSLYFFNFRSHGIYHADDVGAELPNLAAAQSEAVKGAKDILSEKLQAGEALDHKIIEITNEQGEILLTIPLRSVIVQPT